MAEGRRAAVRDGGPDLRPDEEVDQHAEVLIGRVRGAHGVRGELKVETYDPESRALRVGVVVRMGSDRFTIRSARPRDKGWLVGFDGVTDRDAAARLNGRELYAERDSLPPPGPGEHYLADLVGFTVVTKAGAPVGEITGELGGVPQPTLIVKGPTKDHLIPAIEGIVLSVDSANRTMTIDPPDGLLDL